MVVGAQQRLVSSYRPVVVLMRKECFAGVAASSRA